VYRTSLGGHRLLVSAEIDCEEALPDGSRVFVEIKTSGSMQTPESRCNFRERKLIKYWIQSYVAGVPTVVVGYRSEDGVLTV
jgi:RAT1-interacting protein